MNKLSLFKLFTYASLTAFIMAVFSLTLSVNVSASTSNQPLPYFVNDNLFFPYSSYCNAYDSVFGEYYPIDWDNEQILMWTTFDNASSKTYLAYPVNDNAEYFFTLDNNQTYEFFDYSVNTLTLTFVGVNTNWWIIQFNEDQVNGTLVAYGFMSQNQNSYVFGGNPIPNPKYLNGGHYDIHYLNSDLPVFISNYGQGDPVAPANPDDIPDSPNNPPDIDDYLPTPTNPPTISNDINGLVLWLQWKLSFFIDTVKGLFKYLADVIRYVIQKVINNISNLIDVFYNNLQNFFKPFFDKIIEFINSIKDGSLFTTLFVPSGSDVSSLLINNDKLGVYTLYNSLKTFISGFILGISQLQTQKTFFVPASTYHNVTIGGFYLDFSWFDNYKNYSDSIISGFMIIGWIYWLFINLSSVLRGGSSVAEDNTGDHLKSYEGFIGFH